jgi:hypothetical protein
MKDRKSTPDVLGNLMSGVEIKHESNKAFLKVFQESTGKEKATFNLPIPLLAKLEVNWIKLRKMFKSKKVSKTLIVEKALELAFLDFEKLYCEVASSKEIKQ